ncbi:MAG TPA: hypothetical protein VHA11_13095, partial [Bryobacteraceae bacterium]|nr:hypothetical protein [Bryobacteraceae bacterium]
MTNSTNPAESLGAPLEAVSFYRWEVPAKPIAVHLSLDLIERLERDVLESFRAITKRGSEIGGVLVGRVEPGSPATVVIEQFEPVECEYSRGPLYLLAEGDMARLRDAIAKVRGMGGGLTVAGYFRSNTRRELTLDEDDLAIARELFQDPNHVFLLVRPYAMKPSVGGIFIREDGAIHSEAPYLEFPFKRADLIKTMAPFIIGPDGQRAAPAPPREPLVMPKREASPVLKREELRPAAPAARHEEFPALVFKREERPPLIPASARREEHTARREEPAAKPQEPAAQHEDAPARREERKREDRVVIAPVPKASGPTLVTRHEEPAAVPAAPKPEPPAKKPVEVKAAQPEEAPAAAAEDKTEPKPAAAADTELGTMFRGMTLDQAAEPARGNRKWIYILGALLAVAGGGGYFAYRSMTPAPPAAVTAVDTSLA